MSRIITVNSDLERLFGNKYIYFHLEMLDDATLTVTCNGTYHNYINFSINNGGWERLTPTGDEPQPTKNIDVKAGDKIYFKGDAKSGRSKFLNVLQLTEARFNIGGYFLSLFKEDFYYDNTIPNLSNFDSQAFTSYFLSGSTSYKIVDASKLILSDDVKRQCFQKMFRGCKTLVLPPALPATIMAPYCYDEMFFDCSSLVEAPTLPATVMSNRCYSKMFQKCKALRVSPPLPATELAINCYQYMFAECDNLVEAGDLAAEILADYCCQYMFQSCRSLTKAPALPATTMQFYCYQFMFQNCIALIEAPTLPATELAANCYSKMFQGCKSLFYAPTLPATVLFVNCYAYMFNGCTSLVDAPDLNAPTLVSECYQYMFSGCSSLRTIKMLATDVSAWHDMYQWVGGVKSGGTFTKKAGTVIAVGFNGIPDGWEVIEV